MQEDFHYYATYAAAIIAGYSHEDSLQISYADQLTDCCTRTFLGEIDGPMSAATTQLQMELMEARTDILGIQDITRIWASFHFLPYDLYAVKEGRSKAYMSKYRLICNTNSDLLVDTVNLAMGKGLGAAGLAMHILADTWAHRYFAGTPSLVINNTDYCFSEIIEQEDGSEKDIPIVFRHNPTSPDDIDRHLYTNSLYQSNEINIMNLGHGRAGHFPDYSFARYRYLPAWGDYGEIIKDNPSDYYHAFCQVVYALKFLKGDMKAFEKDTYAFEECEPYREEIMSILKKRQLNANSDWKAFGEKLSGHEVEDFNLDKYKNEYIKAEKDGRDRTYLGAYFLAALAQKSMVTNKIYKSGNMLAGLSIDYDGKLFSRTGMKDFRLLIKAQAEGMIDEHTTES